MISGEKSDSLSALAKLFDVLKTEAIVGILLGSDEGCSDNDGCTDNEG